MHYRVGACNTCGDQLRSVVIAASAKKDSRFELKSVNVSIECSTRSADRYYQTFNAELAKCKVKIGRPVSVLTAASDVSSTQQIIGIAKNFAKQQGYLCRVFMIIWRQSLEVKSLQ